ncbi:hypothetical protein QFW77_06480 [Luteimonas sp. RD2P54]|uniref:Uncharacterized protein n=1 Tax=Luteimonas endophytica TaxID=3042023 RepID=A0ABT6J8V9_9GAMM|nr:hypothetical protein [Luteimonas endophytica]MDH5822638.1 hypothetical protein [Luteimonas endophytica]
MSEAPGQPARGAAPGRRTALAAAAWFAVLLLVAALAFYGLCAGYYVAACHDPSGAFGMALLLLVVLPLLGWPVTLALLAALGGAAVALARRRGAVALRQAAIAAVAAGPGCFGLAWLLAGALDVRERCSFGF